MSIEVHIDWQGASHLVGRLDAAERSDSVSFEYAPGWLRRDNAFAIALSLFGAIQDCGPDRWGRVLIERAVRKKVLTQKPYRDLDYCAGTGRIGAGRCAPLSAQCGRSVSHDHERQTSAAGKTRRVVTHAPDALHSETETAQDLRFLLGAGSPLGGARPKAAVSLPDGRLAIAKFPKPDDTRDIGAGEILALTLAAPAGIRVAEHQRVAVGKQSVAVITRFNRVGQNRVPFVSAASLLGLPLGEAGAYTLLADGVRQFGDDVAGDLRELRWRLVFSLLASNYDDHLRNLGCLMFRPGRWSFSGLRPQSGARGGPGADG